MTIVRLDDQGLDLLFRSARSYPTWQDRPIDGATVHALYDLLKLGPTSVNGSPGRFLFIRSTEAKARLMPHILPGNVRKVESAPCCVVIAYDSLFLDRLDELVPGRDLRSHFNDDAALIEETAKRNSALQGGYLIMAARALGLDCGPLSGFNSATLDAEFFPDGRWKSNFLCNIGYGSTDGLHPRFPRLPFEIACLDL